MIPPRKEFSRGLALINARLQAANVLLADLGQAISSLEHPDHLAESQQASINIADLSTSYHDIERLLESLEYHQQPALLDS